MAKVKGSKIQGLTKVIKNLNIEINQIKGRSMKGLIKAAILIRRDMDKTPPVIPVDLGNLRASSFIVASNMVKTDGTFVGPNASKLSSDHNSIIAKEKTIVSGNKKMMVALGFSAWYAEPVESDTTTKRERPGSGGKFFESAVIRNKGAIIQVIKKEAKV